MEILQKKINNSDYVNNFKRIYIISNIFCVLSFAIELPNFLMNKYIFFLWILIIFALLQIFQSYFLYYCMQRKNLFSHIISKRVLPRLSTIYKDKHIKEIKTIIVPCRYNFYDTYFIKTTPSLEDAKVVLSSQIVDLPLTLDSQKIEYKLLTNLTENKISLSLCPGAFIPKKQLSEDEKVQLDTIKNKILHSK